MTPTQSSTRTNLIAGAVAVIVMALAFLAFNGTSEEPTVAADATTVTSIVDPSTTEPPAATTTPETTAVVADTRVVFSDLPTITLDELPFEAVETLLLIDEGGPYPYRQDDGIFQNREGILPDRSSEHYREYTVDTPGASNRGARRIVTGADGERYYTDDHYDSFREISG